MVPAASQRLANRLRSAACFAAAAVAVLAAGPASAKRLESRYLFGLASVNGLIHSSWATLAFDHESHELLVADSGEGTISVYRDNGMEEQRIGGDEAIGYVTGVAVKEGGDLFILARKDERTVILHTDFRGQPIATLELQGIPGEFAHGFAPTVIRYAAGKVFIADRQAMKVLATDSTGRYVASYELRKLIKFDAKDEGDLAMTSFNVDASGDLLFTVSAMFKAFVVSPAGEVRGFGVKGSTPGKFNVVGGIAADEKGYLYVTDLLRAVVIVFDPKFEFIGEFGYHGWRAGNLIAPLDLLVADGELFVAQAGRRGVSAYRVTFGDSEG